MKKFLIRYFFDGSGKIIVNAKNEEDARRMFEEGEYPEGADEDTSENYNINYIEEIK